MWSTGLNNYGQLGLGHFENQKLLQHVEALDGKAVTEVFLVVFVWMGLDSYFFAQTATTNTLVRLPLPAHLPVCVCIAPLRSRD